MSTHNLCFFFFFFFFFFRNKKNNVYPCKLQFYYIKVAFKGSELYRYVFVIPSGQNEENSSMQK